MRSVEPNERCFLRDSSICSTIDVQYTSCSPRVLVALLSQAMEALAACSHSSSSTMSNHSLFPTGPLLICGSSQSVSESVTSSSSSSSSSSNSCLASDNSSSSQRTAQSTEQIYLWMDPNSYDRVYVAGEDPHLRRAILFSQVDIILTRFQFGFAGRAGAGTA